MRALARNAQVAGDQASGAARRATRRPLWRCGWVAALAWLGGAGLAAWWPDTDEVGPTPLLVGCMAAVGLALLGATLASPRVALPRLFRAGPWLVALALLLGLWEAASAKLALLPRPFFATPQSILEVYIDDWPRLGESTLRSLMLLATGYVLGAVLGFASGVAIGWSRAVGYWAHPVLRFVGPLPATAWLPLAFFVFPSSWSAGVFLIALATGFPVTVLTWSGVAGVSTAYYDVARTLGARPGFLILKVAIPAAMPSVFVGLFMGLGASFAVLVVAEMMGVKAGLGWYLSWAQGWAAYANMYAALIVMALMCSGLITLLFRLRDRLLSWQRGLLRW
ncbi:MAG: ABC transporter permease subunit [Acetobacteraceae bacterium]|nr:ABC transporter permease subunit [Acetobacteraceae bacterium]